MANENQNLEGRLDDLLDSTESIRVEIKRENAKHDVRIRTNRRAVIAAILVAIIGVLVGFGGLNAAHDASAAAERAKAANEKTNQILTTSRKASCDAQIDSALKTRKGQKDQVRVEVNALLAASKTPLSPRAVAAVGRFYMKYDATVDRDNPTRDCTPRGIACFLKIAPPAGSKPCDGYNGYLKG